MYQPIPSMREVCSQSPSDSSDEGARTKAIRARFVRRNHADCPQRKVRNAIVSFYNPKNQGRIKAIRSHPQLIIDLKSIQPASISEIAQESGQSISSTRNKLNQLITLDLVKRIRFEHHTLFCLNGSYNLQITSVLSELFD